jgi:peptide subunit release factor 1 (eRF1)
MITIDDVQRLTQRDTQNREILSLYLDMSVTSDNKRTHQIFLSKEKAAFAELQSDRERHHREPLGAVFAHVERWLEENFEPTNKGVVIFAEVGGDWFEAFQFPVAVQNRLTLLDAPLIGPLTQLVHTHPLYGVVIVDREHLRLLSIHMGVLGEDYALAPDAIPTPHDVQAGGYSHKDYQKRKAEETRQFYKEFAEEVARFDARVHPAWYVLLGTTENAKHFREFLARGIDERVVHVGHAPPAPTGPELVKALLPVFEERAQQSEAEALDLLQERVRQDHFAAAGIQKTLEQLQEGKVERLVVARGLETQGGQCTQCGFYLASTNGGCPYCGGALREGVDLVESMIRMAANQSAPVHFVGGDEMRDMKGVGALLKF